MLVEVIDKTEIEKVITYKAERERVEDSISSFVKEIAPRVEAKGFRKGMAPHTVIRSQFKDIILAECSARLVQEEVSESIKVRNLEVVGAPILIDEHRAKGGRRHVGEFNLDGTFSFAVSVDLQPRITVSIPALTISEALPSATDMVEQDIQKIRGSMAQLDFVERAATAQDQVSVELLNGSNTHISVAISDPPDSFADNSVFIGKAVGDEFEAVLSTGAPVKAVVTAVFERKLPDIDDEFAKSAMYGSLEEMRRELEEKRKADFSTPLRGKLYYQILSQLIEANPFSIPDRWIDTETANVCAKIGLRQLPVDNPSIVNQLRQQAERNLRSNILLDAIYGATENIHLSADEVYGIVDAEAKKAGRETDELLSHLRNSGQYDKILSFYERNRVIDHLITTASVKQE